MLNRDLQEAPIATILLRRGKPREAQLQLSKALIIPNPLCIVHITVVQSPPRFQENKRASRRDPLSMKTDICQSFIADTPQALQMTVMIMLEVDLQTLCMLHLLICIAVNSRTSTFRQPIIAAHRLPECLLNQLWNSLEEVTKWLRKRRSGIFRSCSKDIEIETHASSRSSLPLRTGATGVRTAPLFEISPY